MLQIVIIVILGFLSPLTFANSHTEKPPVIEIESKPTSVTVPEKFKKIVDAFKHDTKFTEGLYLLKDNSHKSCMEGKAQLIFTEDDVRLTLSSHPLVIGLGAKDGLKESEPPCQRFFIGQQKGQRVTFKVRIECTNEALYTIERVIDIEKNKISYMETSQIGDQTPSTITCVLNKKISQN